MRAGSIPGNHHPANTLGAAGLRVHTAASITPCEQTSSRSTPWAALGAGLLLSLSACSLMPPPVVQAPAPAPPVAIISVPPPGQPSLPPPAVQPLPATAATARFATGSSAVARPAAMPVHASAPTSAWGGGMMAQMATTAAGVVAGGLLFQGVQSLMGQNKHSPESNAASPLSKAQDEDTPGLVSPQASADDALDAGDSSWDAGEDWA